jgi:ATP-dependent RNA helicase DDX23/PRP28
VAISIHFTSPPLTITPITSPNMAGPLSVEDILAKQKAEKEAAAKPKFLSKAERAKIALEKRNAEVKSQQQRDEEEKAARIAFEQQVEEERRRTEESRYSGNSNRRYGQGQQGYGNQGRDHGRDNYGGQRNDRYNQNQNQQGRNGHGQNQQQPPSGPRNTPTGPRASLNNNQPSTSSPLARAPIAPSASTPAPSAPASPKPNTPGDVQQPSEYEMAVIKSRYLGQKDPDRKQRVKRDINTKKMNFDWAATDDTTAHEQGSWRMDVKASAPGAVMLGGRLAGFDEGGTRRGQVAVDDQ